jgi:hypothetical protein
LADQHAVDLRSLVARLHEGFKDRDLDAGETESQRPRRIDVADLEHVHVAGVRAVRGQEGALLLFSADFKVVGRLVGLLRLDADPSV